MVKGMLGSQNENRFLDPLTHSLPPAWAPAPLAFPSFSTRLTAHSEFVFLCTNQCQVLCPLSRAQSSRGADI